MHREGTVVGKNYFILFLKMSIILPLAKSNLNGSFEICSDKKIAIYV